MFHNDICGVCSGTIIPFIAACLDSAFDSNLDAFVKISGSEVSTFAPNNTIDEIRIRLSFLLEVSVNSQSVICNRLAILCLSDFWISSQSAD